MMTLITAVVFSFAACFSATAFAETQVFGVKLPAGQSTMEAGHRVMGSYVETDHTSFYTSPKGMNDVEYSATENATDTEHIIVFGVKVPVGTRI